MIVDFIVRHALTLHGIVVAFGLIVLAFSKASSMPPTM